MQYRGLDGSKALGNGPLLPWDAAEGGEQFAWRIGFDKQLGDVVFSFLVLKDMLHADQGMLHICSATERFF